MDPKLIIKFEYNGYKHKVTGRIIHHKKRVEILYQNSFTFDEFQLITDFLKSNLGVKSDYKFSILA